MVRGAVLLAGVLAACTLNRPSLRPLTGGHDATADASRPDASVDAPLIDVPASDPELDMGFDTGCAAACERDALVECGLAPRPCALGCSEMPAPHCRTLVPSNVPLDALTTIDTATPAVVLSTPQRWDTTLCSDLPGGRLVSQPSGEVMLCVVRVTDLHIEQALTVVGPHALVVLATGSVEIDDGVLVTLSAELQSGGPGGGSGARRSARAAG